jgi:hypothetical protein
MADNGVTCSMSRSGNVWDNAAMENVLSSLKTERISGRVYRTGDAARAAMFAYIERFYNSVRSHSTLGYLSPVEFEKKGGLAELPVLQTGSRASAASARRMTSELPAVYQSKRKDLPCIRFTKRTT